MKFTFGLSIFQNSQDTSFINVLSWDKVPVPSTPSEPIPFYGGMRVSASRHEKNDISVYAVIAHPEVLREKGKNAVDPEARKKTIQTKNIKNLLKFYTKWFNNLDGKIYPICYICTIENKLKINISNLLLFF